MRFLLHHLLQEAADSRPDAVAVRDSNLDMTYGELDRRSNQLARLLVEMGTSRGDRVGIFLQKSAESVVATYAVMKAGGAYVPLDPEAPPSRIPYVVEDCGIRTVLTAREKAGTLSHLPGFPIENVVVLDADLPPESSGTQVLGRSRVSTYPDTSPDIPVVDQDLAYVLYTSGSTGQPKGVMLTHRNALAFVGWAAREFAITDSDRLSSHAPLHFDLSIFDLYAAAWAGTGVVLVPQRASLFPPQLARFIDTEEITVWYSVPSALTMLTLRGGLSIGDLPSLRWMLFAGEVFPAKYLAELMGLLPHVRFANLYGPTETNVCTWYEIPKPPDPSQDIPIGKAIPNDEVFSMTEAGEEAGPGERGELHVRGATVMRGYWASPDGSIESLVADPRPNSLGDPVYRTGDLAEMLPSGDFRFIGRKDAQVKTRGYRVELGEIETVINSHPGVMQCAVIAVPDELVTNRLIAYVVGAGLQVPEVIAHCREKLPRYMVPETVEFLDDLPKTSTGKVDRQSLEAGSRIRFGVPN